jgi:hypothetical protein
VPCQCSACPLYMKCHVQGCLHWVVQSYLVSISISTISSFLPHKFLMSLNIKQSLKGKLIVPTTWFSHFVPECPLRFPQRQSPARLSCKWQLSCGVSLFHKSITYSEPWVFYETSRNDLMSGGLQVYVLSSARFSCSVYSGSSPLTLIIPVFTYRES